MKIALDFDGVLVDLYTSLPRIPLENWSPIFQQNEIIIVTARDPISYGFISTLLKKANLPFKQIVCCKSISSKIEYLNTHIYDLIIDNDEQILIESFSPSILFGQIHGNVQENCEHYFYISDFNDLKFVLCNRMTFAPGPTPIYNYTLTLDYSHRSKTSETYIKGIYDYFKVHHNRNSVIIQGSASLAIESTISSLPVNTCLCLDNGVFGSRLASICKSYISSVQVVRSIEEAQKLLQHNNFDIFCAVHFETSCSIYNELSQCIDICAKKQIISVIDCVSSFPFYNFPDSDIVITSSSKQLSALPVLGLILYKEQIEYLFTSKGDHLSVGKYIYYMRQYQTPHTSLLPQISSLYASLESLNIIKLKNIISKNCSIFKIDHSNILSNDINCPVLTFHLNDGCIEDFKDFLNVYNMEFYYNSYLGSYFQLSMFNYKIEIYQFISYLLKYYLRRNS